MVETTVLSICLGHGGSLGFQVVNSKFNGRLSWTRGVRDVQFIPFTYTSQDMTRIRDDARKMRQL